MPDNEVIDRILAGEKEAFADLVRRHQVKVIGLCLSLLRNQAEAEDAAQEAFFKAYQALGAFRRGAQFSTWLHQIAYRVCLDVLRKRKRDKLSSLDALVEEQGEQIRHLLNSSENTELSMEQKDLANRVLNSLSSDYRNILIMREMTGFSYEEIASILSISLDAVKGRLKRARAEVEEKLRHLMKPFGV